RRLEQRAHRPQSRGGQCPAQRGEIAVVEEEVRGLGRRALEVAGPVVPLGAEHAGIGGQFVHHAAAGVRDDRAEPGHVPGADGGGDRRCHHTGRRVHHEHRLGQPGGLLAREVRILTGRPLGTVDGQVGGDGAMTAVLQRRGQPVVPAGALGAAVYEQEVHALHPGPAPAPDATVFAQRRMQNSLPSGSASTTNGSSPVCPTSTRVAPSLTTRSTSAAWSGARRSRWSRFLPCFGPALGCSHTVGSPPAGGTRWVVPSGCRSISYPRTSDQNSAIRSTSCTSNVHCAIRLVTADTPPLLRCGRRTR